MKIKRILMSLLVAIVATTSIYAQDGKNVAFLLPNSATRYKINAAYQPEFKSVVNIPVLGGFGVSYMNNSFGFDDILINKKTPYGDSLLLDVNKLHSKMKRDLRINQTFDVDILSVAFKLGKKGYGSVDIGLKQDLGFGLASDLVDFVVEGNAPYIGKTQDIGDIFVDASVYTEIALGYSRKIDDKLTVGGRLKVLFGLANMYTSKSNISVETPAGAENLVLRSQQEIYASLPVTGMPIGRLDWETAFDDIEFDEEFGGSITKNMGFALDLGATYQYNDEWTFGASINDLGFINWKSNVYKLVSDTEFNWQGADVSNSINKNDPDYVDIDDAFENLVDSLTDSFEFLSTSDSYARMLKAKINLYATYQIHKKVNVGAMLRGVMMADKFYPSMTLSANTRPLKNVGISVSYSIYQGNYANIGIGIAPRFGALQPYLIVDNLFGANFTGTRHASFRFGISFVGSALYGRKAAKRGNSQPWKAI